MMIVQKGKRKMNKSPAELIFLGGIGEDEHKWLSDGKEFSRNFKQGYRVYDSRGIAAALTGQGGGLGGVSGIYLVRMEE